MTRSTIAPTMRDVQVADSCDDLFPSTHTIIGPRPDIPYIPKLEADAFEALVEDAGFKASARAVVGEDPAQLLSCEGLLNLARYSVAERLATLSYAATFAAVSPQLVAETYYRAFPADIHVVAELFERRIADCRSLHGTDPLFVVSADRLNEATGHLRERDPIRHELLAYRLRSERRNYVSKLIVGYSVTPIDTFGVAGEEALRVIEEAEREESRGSPRYFGVDRRAMFGNAFSCLSPTDQSTLLRSCIMKLHLSILGDVGETGALEAPSMRRSPLCTGAYAFERLLSHTLERFQFVHANPDLSRQNCDFILDFWYKQHDSRFALPVAQALSAQDARYSSACLRTKMSAHDEQRDHLAVILERLELGQLSMSSEGLMYMGRLYDLGVYNDPAYSVCRLTPYGDMGIFNPSNELVKYFNLGNIAGDASPTSPTLHDLTEETIFWDSGSSHAPELQKQRARCLEGFKSRYFTVYNEGFHARTSVRFNNLSFKEQGGYIDFVANATSLDHERATNLMRLFGEPVLRCFAAVPYGKADELSAAIFELGEKLPFTAADAIFRRYASIIESAHHVRRILTQQFKFEHEVHNEVLEQVASGVVNRARHLAVSVGKLLRRFDPDQLPHIATSLVQDLTIAHREVAVFAEFLSGAKKHGLSFTLADAKEVSLIVQPASSLAPDEKLAFISLARLQFFDVFEPEYAQIVVSELAQTLWSGQATMYFARLGTHLLAICRRMDLADDLQYVGSLSANLVGEGAGVAFSILGRLLSDADKEGKRIRGFVGSNELELLRKYMDRFVFDVSDRKADGTWVIERKPNQDTL